MGRQKPNKPRRVRTDMVAEFLGRRCLDCNSRVTVRTFPGGITKVKLEHANTCPYWGAKANAAGIDRHTNEIVHAIATKENH